MSPIPPIICGTFLAVMVGAGSSHFWSVREMVATYPTTSVIPAAPEDPSPEEASEPEPQRLGLTAVPVPETSDAQKEFFKGLLTEVRALRNENRNLIDQVAETNRDMMKMEFRLDTHSESFRPLPTSEDRNRGDISSAPDDDSFPGVLPPRASPVFPLND